MKVRDFMNKKIIISFPNDTIATVCNLMIRYNVDQILIVEDNKPIGIVSKKDIARRLLQMVPPDKRRPIDKILINRIMYTNIDFVEESTSVKTAAKKMLNNNLNAILVRKGNDIVGILTKTDIVRAYNQIGNIEHVAKDFLNKKIPEINRNHSLNKIIERILERNVDRAIVLDGRKPAGIISLTDIAFFYFKELPLFSSFSKKELLKKSLDKDLRNKKIVAEDIMRKDLITTNPNELMINISKIMLEKDISSLPVVDNEEYIGMITKDEILKSFIIGV